MTNIVIVTATFGILLGLAGLARTVVPILALLAIAGLVVYVAVAQPPLEALVRHLGAMVRGYSLPTVAGLFGSVAGQLVHSLLHGRAA